jgi:hypothetical protein
MPKWDFATSGKVRLIPHRNPLIRISGFGFLSARQSHGGGGSDFGASDFGF